MKPKKCLQPSTSQRKAKTNHTNGLKRLGVTHGRNKAIIFQKFSKMAVKVITYPSFSWYFFLDKNSVSTFIRECVHTTLLKSYVWNYCWLKNIFKKSPCKYRNKLKAIQSEAWMNEKSVTISVLLKDRTELWTSFTNWGSSV